MPRLYRKWLAKCADLAKSDSVDDARRLLEIGCNINRVGIKLADKDVQEIENLCASVVKSIPLWEAQPLHIPSDGELEAKIAQSQANRNAPLVKAAVFYRTLGEKLAEQLRASAHLKSTTSRAAQPGNVPRVPHCEEAHETVSEKLLAPTSSAMPLTVPASSLAADPYAVNTLASSLDATPPRSVRFWNIERPAQQENSSVFLEVIDVLDPAHAATAWRIEGAAQFSFEGIPFHVGRGQRRFDEPPGTGRVRAFEGYLWRYHSVDGSWRDEIEEERQRRVQRATESFYRLSRHEKCGSKGFSFLAKIFEAVFGLHIVPEFRTNGLLLPTSLNVFSEFIVREVESVDFDIMKPINEWLPHDFQGSSEVRGLRMLQPGEALPIASICAERSSLVPASDEAPHEAFEASPCLETSEPSYAQAAHRIKSQKPSNSLKSLGSQLKVYPDLAAAILSNYSVVVSGPPGSGKTKALEFTVDFCTAVANETFKRRKVFGLNLIRPLPVESFSISQLDGLLAAANNAFQEGVDCILLIDEYEMLPAGVYALLGDFGQIIACGDYGQRLASSVDQPIFDFIRRAGGASFNFDLVWRCWNTRSFNIVSALVYGGRYIAHNGGNSPEDFDLRNRLKLIRCVNDLGAAGVCLYARAIDIISQVRADRILIIADSWEVRDTLSACLTQLPRDLSIRVTKNVEVLRSSELRGREFDYVLVSSLDQDHQRRTVEENLTLMSAMLGRFRVRMEAIAPFASMNDQHPAPGPFTDLLLPLAHVSVEVEETTLLSADLQSALAGTNIFISFIEDVPILRCDGLRPVAIIERLKDENKAPTARKELLYKYLAFKSYIRVKANFYNRVGVIGPLVPYERLALFYNAAQSRKKLFDEEVDGEKIIGQMK